MRKYFPGLIAVVCALTISAFNKPFDEVEFLLLHDPVSGGIADNPAEWSTEGSTYGECFTAQNDIACKIWVSAAPLACYYHTVGSAKILNDFQYANAQNPKQCYFEISATTGLGNNRVIFSIIPKRYNGSTYVIDNSISIGTNFGYVNAKD